MNKQMKRTLLLSAITAAMATSAAITPAWAADEQGSTNPLVTVTATRTEQLVKEVPSTTYVITRADLDKIQAQNLQQALSLVPGLQMQTDPHGGLTATIRGAEARHTLILIDGQRIPTELTKARANFMAYKSISMANVKRIEVVEGASSALYGSEAIGGVINIITNDGAKENVTLNVEAVKRDTTDKTGYTASLGYRSGWQGKWNVNVSAQKNKQISSVRDDYQATYEGPRTPIHMDVSYKVTPNDTVKVAYDHVKEELTQHGFGGPSEASPVSTKDATSKLFTIQYNGKHGNTNTMIRYYQNEYSDFFHSNMKMPLPKHMPGGHHGAGVHPGAGAAPGAPMGPKPPMHMPKIVDGKIIIDGWDKIDRTEKALEFNFSKALHDKHLLTYGGEWRTITGVGTRIATNHKAWTETHYDKKQVGYKATIKNFNLYVQDEWQVNDKLLIVPAVRVDTSDTFHSRVSPKLGVTYKAAPDLRYKFNVGSAYSTPGFTELYHSWEMFGPHGPKEPGWYWMGNPNLKPETALNFDVSVEKDFDRGTAKATVFHSHISDYIENVPTGKTIPSVSRPGKDNVWTYTNIEGANITGLTLDGSYRLNDHVDIGGSYTFLDAKRANSDLRLMNKARHTIGLSLSYHNKDWRATIWGNELISYRDSESVYDPKKHESVDVPVNRTLGIWNLLISKSLGEGREVYFGIDNIFGSYQSNRDVDGQVYRLGMNYKF